MVLWYEAPRLYEKIQAARARGDTKAVNELQQELSNLSSRARKSSYIEDEDFEETTEKRLTEIEKRLGITWH